MKFRYFLSALVIFAVLCISIFGQSFAQITWNTFEEKEGLFSIQLPSNWKASEVTGTEALAPIDYIFRYNDKGNSFAWVELMINESTDLNASSVVDSYISYYQQFDDFNLLKSTECNTFTLNDIPACSILSSQQLEGEQRRNVLNVVSISPNGIQTDAVFITSSNIYESFLPVGEFMINSLVINSTAVSHFLENQSLENIKSDLPPIPTQNDTSVQSDLPPIPTQNPATFSELTFRSVYDTFVSAEPLGFGVYNEKASNTFRPGEEIILYIEPSGFEYGTVIGDRNNTLYTIEFSADFTISDTQGNVLGGQKGLSIDKIISHHQNTEVFIPFTITQTTPFPSGNYIITYTIHDTNSGKSFDIVKEIVISEQTQFA